MNKILAFTVIAILLGTLTMVIPYALLRNSDYQSLTGESASTEPTPQEPSETADQSTVPPGEPPRSSEGPPTQEPAFTVEAETTGNGDSLTPDEPVESNAEPSPEAAGAESEASPNPQFTFGETDLIELSVPNLSSIGLLIVPSFLIALGAFLYLKRRRV
jgi:hypothetical protein